MNLIPLEQWFCDQCRGLIESREDGYVEFLVDPDNVNIYNDFKIVHAYPAAPNKRGDRGCYFSKDAIYDLMLIHIVGPDGIAMLLSYLDVGPHKQKVFSGPKVKNVRNWVELFRRLYIPYYEEARLYWGKAFADGMFIDESEESPYQEIFLKKVLDKYS